VLRARTPALGTAIVAQHDTGFVVADVKRASDEARIAQQQKHEQNHFESLVFQNVER
jgi:hypothetical protein